MVRVLAASEITNPDLEMNRLPPSGWLSPCPRCGRGIDLGTLAEAATCKCGWIYVLDAGRTKEQNKLIEQFIAKLAQSEAKLPSSPSQKSCWHGGTAVAHGIAGFKINAEKAAEAFEPWVRGLWFAPSQLRHAAQHGTWKPLLVPYWAFSGQTYTWYKGHVEKKEKFRDVFGRGERQRTTKIDVKGEFPYFFQDRLACAAGGLPLNAADSLGPWALDEVRKFPAKLLKPEQCAEQTMTVADAFALVRPGLAVSLQRVCDRKVRSLGSGDSEGDMARPTERRTSSGRMHAMVTSITTQYAGVAVRHLLLPVYQTTYEYEGQTYQLLVNGQTGKVAGERPYSKLKIGVLTGAIATALLALIIFGVWRWNHFQKPAVPQVAIKAAPGGTGAAGGGAAPGPATMAAALPNAAPAISPAAPPPKQPGLGPAQARPAAAPAAGNDFDQRLADLNGKDARRQKDAAGWFAKATPTDDRRVAVTQALEPIMLDPKSQAKEAAAKALAAWASADNVPAFIQALDSKSAGVRTAALEALGKLRDERAVEPVAAHLPKDRGRVSAALRAMGPVAEKSVWPYLTNKDKNLRLETCKILAAIGTKESVPPLQQTAQDKDKGVRQAAESALKAIAARP